MSEEQVTRPARRAARRLSLLSAAVLVACGGGQGDTARPVDVEEDAASAAAEAAPSSAGDRGALAAKQAGPRPLAIVATPSAHAQAVVDRAAALAAAATPLVAGTVPTGPPDAASKGVFTAPLPWPIIPIHTMLLPDGRLLHYGTNAEGRQGAPFLYAVWDPSLGTGPEAFTVMDVATQTDVFCAGQALLPSTGEALLVGGTVQIGNQRDYGVASTNLYDPATNAITGQPPLATARWYPTVITTANGEAVAFGGRDSKNFAGNATAPPSVATYAPTPEVYVPGGGWRPLTGATSDDAYGALVSSWYYPRAWVEPHGNIFVASYTGNTYTVTTDGDGTLVKNAAKTTGLNQRLPAAMYLPGKIWMLTHRGKAALIELNGAAPVVKYTTATTRNREYGNATVLADGQLWLSGGNPNGNELDGSEIYVSELWNPATGLFTDTAVAALPRLYHSISMLLPDGSVLTGGGGAPGPVTNLNAEIWYPPYLYKKDGTGEPAPRPTIVSAPASVGWGEKFQVTIDSTAPVSKVTWVRTGVVTHDFDSNQRFQPLVISSQKGNVLTLKSPATRGNAPPGYYLLFVFDADGVPSVAKIVRMQ